MFTKAEAFLFIRSFVMPVGRLTGPFLASKSTPCLGLETSITRATLSGQLLLILKGVLLAICQLLLILKGVVLAICQLLLIPKGVVLAICQPELITEASDATILWASSTSQSVLHCIDVNIIYGMASEPLLAGKVLPFLLLGGCSVSHHKLAIVCEPRIL